MGTFTRDVMHINCIHYLPRSEMIGQSEGFLRRFSVNTIEDKDISTANIYI